MVINRDLCTNIYVYTKDKNIKAVFDTAIYIWYAGGILLILSASTLVDEGLDQAASNCDSHADFRFVLYRNEVFI
jgi:hypothetical protein